MGTTLTRWLLRVTGAGLLAASAAIHLDLYLTGYRSIPTIGWLFLLQVIAGFALAAAILAAPLLVPAIQPAAAADAGLAAAGAGFALATLGGYLLSLWVGLFGFREIRTTAGVVAGILEVGAFAALATLAVLTADTVLAGRARPAPSADRARPAPSADRARPAPGGGSPTVVDATASPLASLSASRSTADAGTSRLAGLRKVSLSAVAGATVAAFAVLGASVATANGGTPTAATASGATVLRTTMIGGVSVLTNASGRTLYWFAPDAPNRSVCYGTCAAYWPPVTGSPTAGPGVALSKIGTIRRSDGTLQVTYAGHPLYTYIGDTGPGQASGNNINLNGGLWHEVPAAG